MERKFLKLMCFANGANDCGCINETTRRAIVLHIMILRFSSFDIFFISYKDGPLDVKY